jgi:hypothetical protein
MKKSVLMAAAATFALAGSAQAQVCAGFPSSERGFYFGGRADFPEDIDSYGVEAAYNAAGPLSVWGGLNVLSAEDDGGDDESVNEFRVGAAFEIASLGAMLGPQFSVCPGAEVSWISEDDVTAMQIPIGLGLGADLGTGAGPAISAYAIPALVISRLDVPDDSGFDDETETDFGIRGGVNVGFGIVTVGGEVQHLFVDDADPVFGIRFGVRL